MRSGVPPRVPGPWLRFHSLFLQIVQKKVGWIKNVSALTGQYEKMSQGPLMILRHFDRSLSPPLWYYTPSWNRTHYSHVFFSEMNLFDIIHEYFSLSPLISMASFVLFTIILLVFSWINLPGSNSCTSENIKVKLSPPGPHNFKMAAVPLIFYWGLKTSNTARAMKYINRKFCAHAVKWS